MAVTVKELQTQDQTQALPGWECTYSPPRQTLTYSQRQGVILPRLLPCLPSQQRVQLASSILLGLAYSAP